MLKNIYSRKNKKLLTTIYRNEIIQGKLEKTKRADMTDEDSVLQASHMKVPAGTEVKAHKHKKQKRNTIETNEALLIFKGKVELSIFDIDNNIVAKEILNAGDVSVIHSGGHSMKFLEHSSVYEFKNGPYYGPEKDKELI